MRALLPLALFACTLAASAQETTPTAEQLAHLPQPELYDQPLATRLQQVADQAHALRADLPSFTCKEEGVSQVLRNDEVRKEVAFTATIRAVRLPDGRIEETQNLVTVNGKPANKHSSLPYNVHDAFTRVLTYGSAQYQPCYHYELDPRDAHRIVFHSRRPFNLACGNFPGTEGLIVFDDAGQVMHVERAIPPVESEDWPVPFAAVDMGTVQLGEKSYRLAQRLESERVEGKDTLREDVKFTECKLFTTSIRLLPGEEVPEENSPAPLKPR
ncbi:hypothetical protein ACFQBQ_10165 [Granulicella cerasi]|uniref:Uncharacterized protein n=1 Tax=Granulicella cerasi TaxID=741063 RepID=A0ABW1ZBZ2_9BACT|nr:hypothetical protein [Granulicella cerasi]